MVFSHETENHPNIHAETKTKNIVTNKNICTHIVRFAYNTTP